MQYIAVHYLRLLSHPKEGWRRQSTKNKTRIKERGAEQKRRFWYKGEQGYHERIADLQQKASASPACDNPEDEAKNSRADLSRRFTQPSDNIGNLMHFTCLIDT